MSIDERKSGGGGLPIMHFTACEEAGHHFAHFLDRFSLIFCISSHTRSPPSVVIKSLTYSLCMFVGFYMFFLIGYALLTEHSTSERLGSQGGGGVCVGQNIFIVHFTFVMLVLCKLDFKQLLTSLLPYSWPVRFRNAK